MKVQVLVTLSLNEHLRDIGRQRLRNYINEAVTAWQYQLMPPHFEGDLLVDGDILFGAIDGVSAGAIKEVNK